MKSTDIRLRYICFASIDSTQCMHVPSSICDVPVPADLRVPVLAHACMPICWCLHPYPGVCTLILILIWSSTNRTDWDPTTPRITTPSYRTRACTTCRIRDACVVNGSDRSGAECHRSKNKRKIAQSVNCLKPTRSRHNSINISRLHAHQPRHKDFSHHACAWKLVNLDLGVKAVDLHLRASIYNLLCFN